MTGEKQLQATDQVQIQKPLMETGNRRRYKQERHNTGMKKTKTGSVWDVHSGKGTKDKGQWTDRTESYVETTGANSEVPGINLGISSSESVSTLALYSVSAKTIVVTKSSISAGVT